METYKRDFIYQPLKKNLIRQIEAGRLKRGDCILSEKRLVQRYGISNKSVRKAIKELVEEGYMLAIRGKGVFVVEDYKKKNAVNADTIGVVVSDLAVSFHTEIVRGIEHEAERNGCQIILGNNDNNAKKEEMYLRRFIGQGLNGIIVVTGKNSIRNKYFREIGKDIKLVIVDTFIEDREDDYVTTDDEHGSYEAVKYLISLGHRRIADLTGPLEVSTAYNRHKGYKMALVETGTEIDEGLIRPTDFSEEGGYDGMKRILESGKDVTACVAVNDMVAWGAMRAIEEKALKIPEDISIIGFGDLRLNNSSSLPRSLTTVNQQPYEMGKEAAKLVIGRLRGENGGRNTRKIVLPTRLIIRASTARVQGRKIGKRLYDKSRNYKNGRQYCSLTEV